MKIGIARNTYCLPNWLTCGIKYCRQYMPPLPPTFLKHKRHSSRKLLDGELEASRLQDTLQQTCKDLCCGIGYTNFKKTCSFTHADIQASRTKPALNQTYMFGDIFVKGISLLENYTNSDPSNIQVPEDEECRAALEKLLHFLQNLENESKVLQATSKWTWTLMLAEHFFSKLIVSPNYVYDMSTQYGTRKGCPCDDHEDMIGKPGDTSFGWEEGWHGSTDILMGDLPVINVEGMVQDRVTSSSSLRSSSPCVIDCESFIEVKNERCISKTELRQVFAETISFSFLKNKENKGVTLIPSVAVDKNCVSVHMYDSELDVFLQGGPIPIFSENTKQINISTVIAVWITLNYKLFSIGVIDGMNKAGLHGQIDIDKYKTEVKAPCRNTYEEPDDWLMRNDWLL
ncbi:uncharacterized protein LOC128242152 [Mya arenaria]|uniref:uncharacterized protein LOC128242152 n=1 Tax=Mya arenaria TaxID=6604 RepID=UPI0022E63C2E|nr:uncharacterized protein LOC128242152 [Mya arenaria]